MIDCKEKPSLQTPSFWFTLTTIVFQFLYLCGFAFSVLWHFKPTADVKTELGFPELSTFDGRLVRPLKPQRRMGGEEFSEWPDTEGSGADCSLCVTLSHHWTHQRDGKTECSSRYHVLNETEKNHLVLWILRLLWRMHCYLKWKIMKSKCNRIKESSGE